MKTNNIETLHNKAMDIAEEAFKFKRMGDTDSATRLFSKAFELENKAAKLCTDKESNTLPRSILISSAAALAFNANRTEECKELVKIGLEVAEEDYIINILKEFKF